MDTSEFTVDFGSAGFTLEYRDALGPATFTFGLKDDRTMVLEHFARRKPRPANYDQAFVRVKQFLELRGFVVEEYGIAHPPAPISVAQAEALIRPQMPGLVPASLSVATPPDRVEFEDDANGPVWNLWRVAVLTAGPNSGYQIVFDEITQQFGVANPNNQFLGFWGTFAQTAEALLAD